MKRKILAGTTSLMLPLYIRDSSSTAGAGLTGLAHNTASLTCYYHREGTASPTAVSLVTATVGTFTSSGFKEIDATNMPGAYELHVPNAAIASGAKHVILILKGAANMAPVPIEIELDAVNYQDSAGFGLSRLDATVGSRASQTSLDTVDDFLDTEIAAIKAKTDALPSDPADASDIATSFGTVNTTLGTIAGYLDTEIAAIKAKTDNLPASPAAVGSAMTLATGAISATTFATGAITADAFADDAIGAAELSPDAVDALAAGILATPANLLATDASGRVTVGSLAADSITAASFATDTVTEIAAAVATAVWAVVGWGTWTMKQTVRAIAQVLQGRRSSVPAQGEAGTIDFTGPSSVDYGSVSVDTSGNITSSDMTPPA